MTESIAGFDVDPYNNYPEERAQLAHLSHHSARQYAQAAPQINQYYQMPQNDAEEVLEEIYEEETEQNPIVSEAIERIEQAKLYEMLLTHDLLAANSARPKILHKVQAEMKSFVSERLEILLGMRAEKSPVVKVEAQFSHDEVTALKALASRVMKKADEPTPIIRPLQAKVEATAPIRPLQTQTPRPEPKPAPTPVQPVAKKVVKKEVKRAEPKDEKLDLANVTPEQAAELLSKRDNRRKQAVSNKIVPMPSQEQMNQIMSMQAQTSSPLNGDGVVAKAIQAALAGK